MQFLEQIAKSTITTISNNNTHSTEQNQKLNRQKRYNNICTCNISKILE